MSETRRTFVYRAAMAGTTFGSLLLAQQQTSPEQEIARAKDALAQQKAAFELVRIVTFASVAGNTLRTIDNRGMSEELTADWNVNVDAGVKRPRKRRFCS